MSIKTEGQLKNGSFHRPYSCTSWMARGNDKKMFSTAREKFKFSFGIGYQRVLKIKYIIVFMYKTNEPYQIRVNFYLFQTTLLF